MLSFDTSTLYCHTSCVSGTVREDESTVCSELASKTPQAAPGCCLGLATLPIWAPWGLISPSLTQMARLPPATQLSVLETHCRHSTKSFTAKRITNHFTRNIHFSSNSSQHQAPHPHTLPSLFPSPAHVLQWAPRSASRESQHSATQTAFSSFLSTGSPCLPKEITCKFTVLSPSLASIHAF